MHRWVSIWVAAWVALIVGCGDDESPATTCDPGVTCPSLEGNGQGQCLPNQQFCAQGCADLQADPNNCGACGAACQPGFSCQAGICTDVCGQGLGFCGGQCVSLTSNPNHCGGCDNLCPAGQPCVSGVCSATCDATLCTTAVGVECVSLVDNRDHCGACNSACPLGDICVNSQCALDCGALSDCNGSCLDLQNDNANCGTCGMACGSGQVCTAGACTCAGGLSLCGDACVDVMMDPNHCGACDNACSGGGLCEGGSCAGPDGCSDVVVSDLSLSAIDVFQSVQVPIMENGVAIGSNDRNADLAAGRKTLFRVYVQPDTGWVQREVSARVELTDVDAPTPDQMQVFFAKITPSGASSDDDPNSTFQVEVPPEAIGTSTRYAVTLVECGDASASSGAGGARFPANGYQPVEALETGILKVHIVPVQTTDPAPDTSDTALQAFKERLEAVYPITEVTFTVGQPLSSSASSMCNLVGEISSRRSADGAANDVYYFGLTPGILGGQSGCSGASQSANGDKASCGWAQGFTQDDGTTGAATMCHELGHAHGRLHAPCNVQDPDPNYPYPDADIGVWAYDFRSGQFLEPTRKDMMSYCPEPRSDAWVSDYNYQAILQRVISVNALPEVPTESASAALPVVPWRMLTSDSAGVQWVEGPLYVQGTPEGTAIRAIVHDAHGPMQAIEVYKRDLEDGVSNDAFMLILPQPDASWHAIEVPDLLSLFPF